MEKSSFKNIHKFIKPYLIEDGSEFRLKDHDPADTHHLRSADKPEAQKRLTEGVMLLSQLQEHALRTNRLGRAADLPGHGRRRQGWRDQARDVGRESTRVQVYSFKAPSTEELDHDYLCGGTKCLPERGPHWDFQSFYYEEVLVVRVHPELLNKQNIPKELVTKEHLEGALRRHQFRAVSRGTASRSGSFS